MVIRYLHVTYEAHLYFNKLNCLIIPVSISSNMSRLEIENDKNEFFEFVRVLYSRTVKIIALNNIIAPLTLSTRFKILFQL